MIEENSFRTPKKDNSNKILENIVKQLMEIVGIDTTDPDELLSILRTSLFPHQESLTIVKRFSWQSDLIRSVSFGMPDAEELMNRYNHSNGNNIKEGCFRDLFALCKQQEK